MRILNLHYNLAEADYNEEGMAQYYIERLHLLTKM